MLPPRPTTFFLLLFLSVHAAARRTRAANSLYPAGKSAVTELAKGSLTEVVQHAPDGPFTTLVEFYAPWCPHCQHFAPKYEKVAAHFVGDQRVRVCAVDCVAHDDLCKGHVVKGYPTLKVFHAPGEPASLKEEGFVLKVGQDPAAIWKWVEARLGTAGLDHLIAPPPAPPPPPPKDGAAGDGSSSSSSSSSSPPSSASEAGHAHSWDAETAAAAAAAAVGGFSSGTGGNGHALADPNSGHLHAHAPLRPSLLMADSSGGGGGGGGGGGNGERWSAWTAPDERHSPARARLGDAAASLLFGLHYGVFVEGDVSRVGVELSGVERMVWSCQLKSCMRSLNLCFGVCVGGRITSSRLLVASFLPSFLRSTNSPHRFSLSLSLSLSISISFCVSLPLSLPLFLSL